MKSLRHYFEAKDLDEIQAAQKALTDSGINPTQLHVLSKDTVGVDERGLNQAHALVKRDVVRSARIGLGFGVLGAAIVLAVAALTGLPGQTVGWTPYAFLAGVVLIFCVWEGGFFGFQQPNHDLEQLNSIIEAGNHVFLMDLTTEQRKALLGVLQDNDALTLRKLDVGRPNWMIRLVDGLSAFIDKNLLSQSRASSS